MLIDDKVLANSTFKFATYGTPCTLDIVGVGTGQSVTGVRTCDYSLRDSSFNPQSGLDLHFLRRASLGPPVIRPKSLLECPK